LAEGLRLDFSPAAHYLIRLRLLHPGISIGTGVVLLALAYYLRVSVATRGVLLLARLLTLGVILQLVGGLLNVFLLAPVWMQIVHLLLANIVWILLILTSCEALAAGERRAVQGSPIAISETG
jgi:heme A synthase